MKFNLVGEIGCNHLGKMDLAKEHIATFADFAKVPYLKFQKRTISDLLTPEEYAAPHPNPDFAHGKTYGEHRENLEFTIEQHEELFEYCQSKEVVYACSAWDLNSAKELIKHLPKMHYLKVPSASNLNFPMLEYVLDHSNFNLHISTGMTSLSEIEGILNFLVNKKAEARSVIYACTSGYPIKFEEMCLLEVSRLKEWCDGFAGVGFSNHGLGIAMDIAAATLGATWIERHVVTCRSTIRHTDSPASLEPDGARRLVRDLDALEKALTYKNDLLDVELVQRTKLKRNK